MQVGNLNVNNYDLTLAVLWCAIALLNGRALIMLASLAAYIVIQAVTATDFQAFLIVSAFYFYCAQANIKNLSTFRAIFLCFGAVYFLGAIDQAVYYHFDLDTHFDRMQPYLITLINAYALATLIGGGGKQDAGLIDYISANCMRWLNGLSLR